MNHLIYDTTFLQLQSLIRFANKFGYEFDGRRFYTRTKRGIEFISLDTLQQYHNNGYGVSWAKGGCGFRHENQKGLFELASKEKLVVKTYLQYSKKLKRFTVQQNLVKFTKD